MLIDTTLYFNGALRLSRHYRAQTSVLINTKTGEQFSIADKWIEDAVRALDNYAHPDALINVSGTFFTPSPGYVFRALASGYEGA